MSSGHPPCFNRAVATAPKSLITQDHLDTVLANYENWFRQGSNLFRAAMSILKGPQQESQDGPLYVGREVAHQTKSEWAWQYDFGLISTMLFAMATECWLKGLIVMELDNLHEPKIKEARRRMQAAVEITEVFSENGLLSFKLKNPSAYRDAVVERDKAVLHLSKEARKKLIPLRGGDHELMGMARAAGISVRKGSRLARCLRELSVAIQLGRYPALFVAEKHLFFSDGMLDGRLWESVRDVVFARHEELLEQRDALGQSRKGSVFQ